MDPMNSHSPQHSNFKNEKIDPDDGWREHSDSSDSGIYGKLLTKSDYDQIHL